MSQAVVLLMTLDQVKEAITSVVQTELGSIVREAQHVQAVFTEKEAATYLCMSPETLRHRRRESRGPHYTKYGRSIRYRKKDIDDWVMSNRVLTAEATT